MKKNLLIFLGIFIFMIIPKNVYAEEIYPWSASVGGTNFTNTTTSYGNNYIATLDPGESKTFNVFIDTYDYDSLNLDESFGKFPYVLLYFQTVNTIDQIKIAKSSACTSSCFNSRNVGLKFIGTDITSGRNQYVLILQSSKWTMDCGVGSGQCIYSIADTFTLTNNNLTSSSSKAFIFYNVVLTDNANIISDDSINFNNLITNASNNANSIMSNANQNRQLIITNAIQNATNIIQNQNNNTTNITDNANSNRQQIINNQNTNQAQTNQKLDDVKTQQQQTNQKLDNVNNSLNSEEGVANNDVSNKANEWSSKLAGTGPVSNMVLMPITLLNGYVSGFNSSCTPYNLGNLYGTNLTLPCINISNYVGSNLWSVIDVLFSGFMIYAIGKKFVKIFNDFTNLRDNQMDELYGGGK